MRPTVLLFDIDGTLITTAGAARRALESAMARELGVAEYSANFGFGGMTDRAIFRRALAEAGVDPTPAAIDAVLSEYLAGLSGTLSGAVEVHRGVRELLAELRRAPDVAIGLGTGNVEAGAKAKLGVVDLWREFAFGGFGSDAEVRAELIAVGAARGAGLLSRAVEECRVVVIGDTALDVAAAHANGFACAAVATGWVPSAELAAAGAEWVFESLSDPGVAEALLIA